MRLLANRMFRSLVAMGSALPIACAAPAQATPSVVIDAATGQILEQEQPTATWYPASLTKLMTIYVALDAVRQNRLTLDTPLVISARAARMAPTKMGFRVGSEVTLRNALIMLMVKSANDIAVAIAEGVSGSVEAFADEMNKASATLGMHESNWVNPNGLPDERQVTSARDLAVLARALLQQFPQSAEYYNIGAMQLGNQIIPTHNGMLGRYPGADGMKTGFTCPAGYNLVASATHGGQKLIAVVLGAPSPVARTAKAASLLDRGFQSGAPQGSIGDLPSPGITLAPDMRDAVCRHRAKAQQQFMAEVEDMSIPIAPAGARGQQMVNVKELALLPRPQFEPVKVFAGRAPGYEGPIARARPAGAPVGAEPEASAYADGKPEGAEISPILRPAPDAKPMRHAAKGGRIKGSVEAKPALHHAVAGKSKLKVAAVEPKKASKAEAKRHKTEAKDHKVEAKGHKEPAAQKHAGKAHAAKHAAASGAKAANDQ